MNTISKIICIVLVVIAILFITYHLLTVKIKFDVEAKDVRLIRAQIPGPSIYTQDENSINRIIEDFEGIRYFRWIGKKTTNKSPDSYIVLIDGSGSVIEEIEYYGGIAFFNNNYDKGYGIMPYTYMRLEKLFNEINAKN